MKKYYFKIGLCAFLLFSNACQKSDNQESMASKKEVKTPAEVTTNSPKSQEEVSKKDAQPFITSGGDLFMPLERQGTVATKNASKFENVKTAAVLESMEQSKAETFLVKNDEPQQIDLQEGTKIYVPDNAFVLAETGELVTGEVKIEAKEVRNVAECLKMGVTTMSNAGLLESGGMLYVGATYEGKKCELQQGKELTVEMPSWGEKKEGMKLFTGARKADGKVEWEEMPENQIEVAQPENPWKKYTCSTYQQKIDSIEEYIINHQMSLADLKMGFKNTLIRLKNIFNLRENPSLVWRKCQMPLTKSSKIPFICMRMYLRFREMEKC